MSLFFLIWCPKAQKMNLLNIAPLIFWTKTLLLPLCASQCLNLLLLTLMYYSTNPGFLEYWWVFFTFWRQLFHLFLAEWGFPSLGINQFHAGCGTAPTIIFVLLLSQAENDLPPHGQCITGTEPGPLIKVRTWLYTLLLRLLLSRFFCFTLIFFLLPSFELLFLLFQLSHI